MTGTFPMLLSGRPLRLSSQRIWRPFTGGRELDRLAGKDTPTDGHLSEEWILSTTRASLHAMDNPEAGISTIRSGDNTISLMDTLLLYPEEMLGKKHIANYGAEMGILGKLIDSRDRLAIQVHPDKVSARLHFNSPFGKTESWHILGLRHDSPVPPRLFLGFRKGVTREAWRSCFIRQDVEEMLSMLHSFTPAVGETYLVPGGAPHAVGEGCLIAELQEATDITLRMEKILPGGVTISEEECHLGIGVEGMMDCFHFEGMGRDEAKAKFLMRRRESYPGQGVVVTGLIGHSDTECFAIDTVLIASSATMKVLPEDTFSGLYVLGGKGRITWNGGEEKVSRHDQFFIPAGCEEYCLTGNDGDLELLRFFGPALTRQPVNL